MELYKVVGINKYHGAILCCCSTYEKAKKAVDLLVDKEGISRFSLCIVQDEFSIDKVWINHKSVDL